MKKDKQGGAPLENKSAESRQSTLETELERLGAENLVLAEKLSAYEDVCTELTSDSALFLTGPVVMFKWKNAPGWPVSYVSPNVENLMGFLMEEFILGKVAFVDVIHPDDLPRVTDEVTKYGMGGFPSFTHEPYRIRKKDGKEIWVLDHTAFIREKDGNIRWLVGYLMDISDHVRVEQKLKESEQRWQFALEGNRDGVWDWNLKTHEVFFSRRWKEMLGFDAHEIRGNVGEWESRIHPKDKDRARKDLNDHLAGVTQFYENTHRIACKDGTYKWIFDRGKVVERADDGRPLRVIGTHTDVTGIKKAEEELRTSRANLGMAQTLAKLGNWSWRKKDNKVDCSREVYRIFGRNPAEKNLDYREFLSQLHPNDEPAVRAAIEKTASTGGEYKLEHRIILENGRVKHIRSIGRALLDDDGRLKGMFGTIQDITERKQAEQALASREKMMRAMADASYDALIMIDSADTVLFWSPAAEKMFGWTRTEALGQKMHPLITPEDQQEDVEKGLKAFVHTGTGPVLNAIGEFTAKRKNGELFQVERSISSFKSENGYYAVGNLRDITHRKKAEQKLQSFAERVALASDAGEVGIWEWNIVTGELTWDRRMHELYGVAPEKFGGRYPDWKKYVHPGDIEALEKELEKAVQTAGEWRREFRVIRPDKEVRHIQAAGRVREDEKGRIKVMVGINQDITQSKTVQEKLRRMATTDGLTGIWNRRRFMELAQKEVERSLRYNRPLSLIMFDADRFKDINDTHGHDVGDKVLQAIAKSVLSILREMDIFGRIGGEEFAVILPETDIDAAAEAAERLRKAVASQAVVLKDNTRVTVTISLGVAKLKNGKAGLKEFLKQADTALYQAKNNGRNQVKRA